MQIGLKTKRSKDWDINSRLTCDHFQNSMTSNVSSVVSFVLENLEFHNSTYTTKADSLSKADIATLKKIILEYNGTSCAKSLAGKSYFQKMSVRRGTPAFARPHMWLLTAGIDLDELESSLGKCQSQYNATLSSVFGTHVARGLPGFSE